MAVKLIDLLTEHQESHYLDDGGTNWDIEYYLDENRDDELLTQDVDAIEERDGIINISLFDEEGYTKSSPFLVLHPGKCPD